MLKKFLIKNFQIDSNWLWRFLLVSIFLASLVVRFWGLDRFYYLVFDEDHYVPHAYGYLTNQTDFVQDIHPPLGRYLIAVSIWLDAHNPFTSHDKVLPEVLFDNPDRFRDAFRQESLINPFSYRWLTAFCGALIPVVLALIAHSLTQRKSLGLIAGTLGMLDGYLIIESRFALINIFLVLFGLVGCYGVLQGVQTKGNGQNLWLSIGGIFLGCSVAVKWSGLWFMFGIFGLIIGLRLLLISNAMHLTNDSINLNRKNYRSWLNWFFYNLNNPSLQNHTSGQVHTVFGFSRLSIGQIFIYLILIPSVTYTLLWIPHLPLNQGMSFIDRHQWILESHLISAVDGHPNCSRWYQWLFATAPVGYYLRHYEVDTPLENITIMQGYGNPIVWWSSSIVIGMISIFTIYKLGAILVTRTTRKLHLHPHEWLFLYVTVNYWANLLPWVFVRRCIFQYHYLPAYSFAIIGLAWLVDLLILDKRTLVKTIGSLTLLSALLAFQFWLPIFVGLPMSAQDYEQKLWLRSWHEGWVFTRDRGTPPNPDN